MKKVLFLCAAVIAAMNMSAAITEMTCAEAAAAAALLPNKTTGTDSVAITGYVTSTDGRISKGQQTFWMDDNKGSVETFEGYYCNLPADALAASAPINVGDKVRIAGFLQNYNGTYEMKNGDVTILERAIVVIDTIQSTICEAIEEGESLADGKNTTDFFEVMGPVASLVSVNEKYHNQTLYMECADNSKLLQVYSCTVMDPDSTVFAGVGDTIKVIGRLKKYGTTIEIVGSMWIVGKAAPIEIDTITATVAEATTAGLALKAGFVSTDVYIVTGYVDSIVSEFNAEYSNMSFYMCDDMAAPTYNFQAYRAIIAQAATLGSKVQITGNLKHYFSKDSVSTIEIEKGACEIIELAGLEQIVANPKAEGKKMIVNGRLYLIGKGVAYDALGNAVAF